MKCALVSYVGVAGARMNRALTFACGAINVESVHVAQREPCKPNALASALAAEKSSPLATPAASAVGSQEAKDEALAESERVHIIGIGDDGVEGLTAAARQLIEDWLAEG